MLPCFLEIILVLLFMVDGAEIIQRNTKLGGIIGVVYTTPSGNVAEKYLGLPYAQPPVDGFRFEITNNATYPVLFWIHGGSYRSWGGDVFDVDGAIDNFASKGVILVTINYRLGLLGFMSLLNSKLPGNYGLEDQLLALKWVNKYIDDFNGDKDSITICGESAGAASVNLLAFSPKSRSLFHKIIMISGSALAPWAVAPELTKHFTEEMITHVQCRGTDVLQCLKSIPYSHMLVGELIALVRDMSHNKADPLSQRNRFGLQLMLTVTPVADSYRGRDSIMPFPLRDLISMSNAHVPVLIGFSKGELPKPGEHRPQKLEYLLPLNRFNNRKEAVEKMKKYYCGNNSDEACSQQGRQINNDYIINVPTCMMANLFEKRHSPTYVYCYDLKNDGSDEPAEHIADVAFLFNNKSLLINNMNPPDLPVPAERIKLFIFDSFLSFIKTGDPNNNESPSSPGIWPKYKRNDSTVIRIQNDMIKMEGCYENETEFWQSLDVEYANYSTILL